MGNSKQSEKTMLIVLVIVSILLIAPYFGLFSQSEVVERTIQRPPERQLDPRERPSKIRKEKKPKVRTRPRKPLPNGGGLSEIEELLKK